MYATMIKNCVRSNVQLGRSYGIVTSIHLFNNNNNSGTQTISKTTNYEVLYCEQINNS